MNTTEQILLIILSAALTVFLIFGIIVLIKLNKVMGHINNITAKAEKIADQAEHFSSFFSKSAGPVAATKIVANIIGSLKSKDKEK